MHIIIHYILCGNLSANPTKCGSNVTKFLHICQFGNIELKKSLGTIYAFLNGEKIKQLKIHI